MTSSSTICASPGVQPRSETGHVRYIVLLCTFAFVVLSPLAASALFLFQSGELSEPRAIARWLQRTGGIYGTALNSNAREVALSIFAERKPEIIVLSSSRGTEFRQEFFVRNFSCACMIMSNLEEGLQFQESTTHTHRPQVVIIGLDYWWFSKSDDHVTRPPLDYGPQTRLTWQKVIAPFKWMSEGKMAISQFLAVSIGISNLSPFSTEQKSGFQAVKNSFGTRRDGSWAVLNVAANVDDDPAMPGIKAMLKDPSLVLKERSGRYAPDQELDEKKLALFKNLISNFERQGTRTVLVLLPVAEPILDMMAATGRYRFVWELKERLEHLGREFYDFLDPRTAGGTVCEFQDQHHAGNALYARILKLILDRNPNSVLKDYVDYPAVSRIAEQFAGRVVATLGSETAAFVERDFLDVGCKK